MKTMTKLTNKIERFQKIIDGLKLSRVNLMNDYAADLLISKKKKASETEHPMNLKDK